MQYRYVIGYLRLSWDDGDKEDESNSIKSQRFLIQQFIDGVEEFKGSEVLFFSDDGYSGTNFKRPDFQKMMALVKSKTNCCIIVKDLSRLGRDTVDVQNYIEKVFPFLQVRFIAINDYYDSNDTLAAKKDTEVKFKNLVNGIYPQICSQNIKQVMRKQAEAGKYHGSIPPFGYQFNGNDKTSLLLDKEASPIIRLIFDKRMEGLRYSEIADYLNESRVVTPMEYLQRKGFACFNSGVSLMWTSGMVKKILINPIYTGTMVNHKTENMIVAVKSGKSLPREEWICISDTHEAIVSMEEFNKVLSMIKSSATYPKRKIPRNIFRGKLRCGYCKRMLRVRDEKNRKRMRASCNTHLRISETPCYEKAFYLEEIEKIVLCLVQQQALLAEDTLRKIKKVNQTLDIPRLKRQAERYDEKIQQCNDLKMELYEKYVTGELLKADFIKEKEKIALQVSKYHEKKAAVEKKISEAEKKKALENAPALRSLAKYVSLESLSFQVVQELIDVIYFYDPEHIEVIWNFKDDYLETAEKNAG